ncbi:helix-turn-helix domain-containing protein [Microbacterium sp. SA39]|uniref:helix-turn-helix domain-containing protein n=1 Tax=Microbacterium sp. SA39 TaxID=1263625 RepID=UPI0005F9AF8B|nr:PucR family transcriptional regulator [Microbacterium sp. SA39]KJQ52899.1 Carbohydrate diacid regulator [Microbacterium sp. SA39]
MRVRDLLEDDVMGVSLRTNGQHEQLSTPISGCAQSELMDPTPYLQRGELMLTTGMALHFEDHRTWEAYVERLASVPISALAFSIGRVHGAVPDGLITACDQHGIPLLELPEDLPLLQFSRHIWQELAAQRYEIVRAGWELADDCTRLATHGVPIVSVLERIAEEIDANVALMDPGDFILASAGPSVRSGAPSTALALPGGSGARFTLRIRGGAEGQLLQPLLGPVAAVLAMQLSYTLASSSPLHSAAGAHLVQAALDDATPPDSLLALAERAGFDPGAPWQLLAVACEPSASTANARLIAWRLQVHLESRFGVVCFFEQPEQTVFLLQHPSDEGRIVDSVSATIDPAHVGVVFAENLAFEELPLALRMAVRQSFVAGVRRLPALDIASIVHSLPSSGLRSLSRRVLAPLEEADPSGTLTETLRSFLRHSGTVRAIGDELFIHRNTLAYRVRRIETLLGVDLQDGETRATLLLALHVMAP